MGAEPPPEALSSEGLPTKREPAGSSGDHIELSRTVGQSGTIAASLPQLANVLTI